MIFSIFLTFILFGSFYFCLKNRFFEFNFHSIRYSLQKAVASPSNKDSIILLVFFLSFLLFPLFWGLTFFLKTDANVVVVLIFMTWCYNWIKYIFLGEAEDRR
ncbi:MAG: hypothetical protein HUU45_12685 [Leptospiraceae bacterium]|nr:hypothetical protein [Leptospiraceae bacterium]